MSPRTIPRPYPADLPGVLFPADAASQRRKLHSVQNLANGKFRPIADIIDHGFTRRSEKATQVVDMDPLADFIERLKRHHELVWKELPGGVRIEAPSPEGFAVEVHRGVTEWTVYLGNAGFHEAFDSGEEALQFVAWCNLGEARVREIWLGDSPLWSALEAREDDKWRSESETRFIFVPFWRKRREVVLENPNLLRPLDG